MHSHRRREARLAAAGLGGLAAIRSVLLAGTPPIRVKDKEDAGRARPIAVLKKVRLGGSDQWILERSEDVRNPVLLYFRGILGSLRLLWPELSRVDLFESVPELKVSVFFMEARSDWESPYEIRSATSTRSRRCRKSSSGSTSLRTCPIPRKGTCSTRSWWRRCSR